jgi:hypothetical protein
LRPSVPRAIVKLAGHVRMRVERLLGNDHFELEAMRVHERGSLVGCCTVGDMTIHFVLTDDGDVLSEAETPPGDTRALRRS